MKIASIYWTEDSVDHVARHGVEPEEVEEACHASPFVLRGRGPKKRKVYRVYGRSSAGRYLFIVVRFLEGSEGMVITARDMTDSERKLYRGRRP